jgi:hypothetical protein
VYNDSGKEQTCSESAEGTEETEDKPGCISSLQRLYTVFLPPHLKQQHPVSNWKMFNILTYISIGQEIESLQPKCCLLERLSYEQLVEKEVLHKGIERLSASGFFFFFLC